MKFTPQDKIYLGVNGYSIFLYGYPITLNKNFNYHYNYTRRLFLQKITIFKCL